MLDYRTVTVEDFESVVALLGRKCFLSFDTETTGLRSFHGDRVFSIIIGDDRDVYYFNFQNYNTDDYWQHKPEQVLPREYIPLLQSLFEGQVLFAHNAKFDMHMLYKEGIRFDKALVWCTETGARVEYNDHMKYSLQACAERIGEAKDDAVEEYIKKFRLWEWVQIPGKKKREKNKFYSRVPFGIIQPYGIQDVIACFRLGKHQQAKLSLIADSTAQNRAPITETMTLEMQVTKATQNMEREGLLVDVPYVQQGIEYYAAMCEQIERNFQEITGLEFKDSNKVLAQAFTNMGLNFPTTAKGNPSFTDEVLEKFDNPVAELIREWRDADKKLNTYFRSFLYWRDGDDKIHADFRQAGTATGRFSCRNPNLQNVPKGSEGTFNIRKAFIVEPDYILVAIDYNQMEFRMMLDYAGEMDLINRIMNGHDPHTATADLVGIERRPAKTLNFGLLYGMGVRLLAEKLGVDVRRAKEFKGLYFEGLPKVKNFLRRSTRVAEKRGYVFDWAGRRFHFPDSKFAYKAANSIIQGGCASVVKKAMVRIDECVQEHGYKSRPIAQIHDEILFKVHKSELGVESEFQKIMENIYPYKHIPLTCSIEHSKTSWGELEVGPPQ